MFENQKTIYSVEKHYKEKNMIDRCANIQKYATYLSEQIKEGKSSTVYVGSLEAEMYELVKTFHELKSVDEKLQLIKELEKDMNCIKKLEEEMKND